MENDPELELIETDRLIGELFRRSLACVILLEPNISGSNVASCMYRFHGNRRTTIGMLYESLHYAKDESRKGLVDPPEGGE